MLEMLVGDYIKRDVFRKKSKMLINNYWESFNIYQVQIQGKMVNLRKILRIALCWMMNMLRRKRWSIWKVITVEVTPMWLIPQSIISKVWIFCEETFVEEIFYWLNRTFRFSPWHFQTHCQYGYLVKFQKVFLLTECLGANMWSR